MKQPGCLNRLILMVEPASFLAFRGVGANSQRGTTARRDGGRHHIECQKVQGADLVYLVRGYVTKQRWSRRAPQLCRPRCYMLFESLSLDIHYGLAVVGTVDTLPIYTVYYVDQSRYILDRQQPIKHGNLATLEAGLRGLITVFTVVMHIVIWVRPRTEAHKL